MPESLRKHQPSPDAGEQKGNAGSVTGGQGAKIAFLVVAGGLGARAGDGPAKQYRPMMGRSLLEHTLAALWAGWPDAPVQLVLPENDLEHETVLHRAFPSRPLLPVAAGGATRQDSVRMGLEALAAQTPPDFVLVHDAARPFVSGGLIQRVVTALQGGDFGAIPALAVSDTLKRGEDGLVGATVPRDGLYRAQTPQGFAFAALLAAHRAQEGHALTDDAAVMEAAGHSVRLVEGDADNFKITYPQDFARGEALLAARTGDVRTGTGFDVHRFGPGDHVTLCGIKIPYSHALMGHSDADVALHALTDAILAALADGDIGSHFPPGEADWAGMDSAHFLRFAAGRVAARGGLIAHLALTLICERPKIGPHRASMAARIAEIAGIGPARVSVQATTTEKLGFTGRGEGIAAQAAATVRLPFAVEEGGFS
ncbi:bifunctional 2-C-methyl-D-erythritol 4-phosphate cytidylyltransferase/2-C-methyl-D-erythritol 2,4-cyclodiphosphate synthase [Eilatimonas milleporae]|uniref:Bifunctional enzyme IspD/IspF n=1 Tax=Eilatimonas milleporae TaxID=911205 RepID=A0A3M0CGN3_9PROT|nr:bifunctional 2-C-methyl-D-erythritol 4-phosphate cytidylyltransferase/2-C-methyl-D-erythritol 2,4-cyclodiphosphate synthase [Eilatimonas milleporae]RMB08774.1 2-C-methyl-D-erythritol 2,4-cyclodiphosphate synthase [Eilatimonas milleporae]